MHSLPPELLQRIFHDYLTLPATVQNITRPVVRHSFHSFSNPIILTHVCRFWRALACQDPFLWTSMFIIGPTRKMLPLIDLWLQRAANFELSLHFMERFLNRSPEEVTAVSYELFKILWKWRYAWVHVDFQFEEILDCSQIQEVEVLLVDPPAADDRIRVRTARLIDNRSGELNLTVPLWLNVVNNPNLQKLEVGHWCLDVPPHQNLRELSFTDPLDLNYAVHYLNHCPRLEKFVAKIHGTPGEESMLLPEGSVVRDQLRHLEITAVGQISALPIFGALTCPRLEFFSAELNGGYIESLRALLAFICRSNCRLHTFKGLNIQYLNEKGLYHLFSLPQLRDLETLLVSNADDDFCNLLTLPTTHNSPPNKSNSPPILPKLKYLDFIEIVSSSLKFSDMLMSRFNSLKQVQIASERPLHSLLEYHCLWDFPGTISRVDHVGGIDFGINTFDEDEMSWDPETLFTGIEKNPPLQSPPGGDPGVGGSRFGRRPVWDTLNGLERVGRGCY